MKTEEVIPRRYQKEGIRFLDRTDGRALLGDDMGLGKTFQVLKYRQQFHPKATTVIVCPKDAKYVWEQEAKLHVGKRVRVLETTRPPEGMRLLRHRMYAVNYEILGAWLPKLLELEPSMVIIDECQRIMNRKAKCSRNTRKLCENARRIIAMSGTPFKNRPAELFPVINILWPKEFPSFWAYGQEYCDPEKKPWGWEFKGATNVKKLRKKLKRLGYLRRRKSQVLKDLPPKTREIIPVTIYNMKEYQEAEKDLIRWLSKTQPDRADKARKAERLTRMTYLKGLVGRLKVKGILDWIKRFEKESDDKLLVFGVQRETVVQALHEKYRKTSVIVTGKVTGKKRKNAYDAFNYNKRIRFLYANMIAAGTAWSCKSSSTVAFCELGWNPADHTQAEDRVYGLGRGRKGRKMTSYYLVGRGTIDEYLCRIIQKKQEVSDSILDGTPTPESLHIYDKLEEYLLKKGKSYAGLIRKRSRSAA